MKQVKSGEEPQVVQSDEVSVKAQKFHEEYSALCKKYGMQVVVQPVFVGTNHNTYELTLQAQIGQLPKN